mgnify:CR=1 FL=1
MEGLNPLDILIHIINFIVTFVLLYLLLYKPVSKFMHKRRESVEQALADAAATRAEADAYLAEAKAELAATGEKARRLSHEAIENAALDAERSGCAPAKSARADAPGKAGGHRARTYGGRWPCKRHCRAHSLPRGHTGG